VPLELTERVGKAPHECPTGGLLLVGSVCFDASGDGQPATIQQLTSPNVRFRTVQYDRRMDLALAALLTSTCHNLSTHACM
jgi:hypothetical protein